MSDPVADREAAHDAPEGFTYKIPGSLGGRLRSLGGWLWTALMAFIVLLYVVARFVMWATPDPSPLDIAPTAPIVLPAGELEVVEVPNPNGPGTIKSLGRKRSQPQLDHVDPATPTP
jgi:hypothetical protein